MLGKIVQLLSRPMQDGFKVYEGVEFKSDGTFYDFPFAELSLMDIPKKPFHPTYCSGLELVEEFDGFKKFKVNNCGYADTKPEKGLFEDRIWVIVPYSKEINTTAKKIAGRYPTEGLFEMKTGDVIKVCKAGAEPEFYMAAQVGFEMFLIKRTR